MNNQIIHIFNLLKEGHPISTDSRTELEGFIFFALKGDHFDGNEFITAALQKGAAMVVCDNPKEISDKRVLKVPNTLAFLQNLALHYRKSLNIPVIAIAGSNGKTTTKELVSKVLSKKFNVFATPGNLNNHIGVPLSILSIKTEHEIAVIELGANHLGENKLLTDISLPGIGIMTNIGKDHLGEFGGFENVVKAYKEFVDYFNKNIGFPFIYSSDDENIYKLLKKAKSISFGTSNADYNGIANTDISFLKGQLFWKNEKINIQTQLFGKYNIYNILAAQVIADLFSIEKHDFIMAIEEYEPKNMRSQIISWHNNTVFLDSYNANPSSMSLAIKDFNALSGNNKIIILGDMHELGEYGYKEHSEIINLIKNTNYKLLILVGKLFGKFKDEIPCFHFENAGQLKNWFSEQNFTGYKILVKGSRSEKLEEVFKQ